MKKRILITGISGLLGNSLAYCLKDSYDVLGVYHSNKVDIDGVKAVCADLTSGDGLSKIVDEYNPDVVIHCAAQANVDVCENYPLEAEKINVFGTQYLVQNIHNDKTKFIYISTDLVYDGEKGNFSEDDGVGPLNVYGKSKREAEEESLRRENSLVVRTNFFGCKLYGNRLSIAEWVIHELSKNNEINGFTDCYFSSIYTFELARLLDLAIQKDLKGTYNLASSTAISKYEFLVKIANKLGLNADLIKPITVDEFGLDAKRSKNLHLNVDKLAKALSTDIPSIDQSIEHFVEDYKNGIPETFKSYRSDGSTYPDTLEIIPYGRQSIDEEDISAVTEVLKSDAITQGTKVKEFQSSLCTTTDSAHSVVVNSGTSALHIACLAAGVCQGDEVVTSPNTFVASANCAVYCGAKPVFADIDPRTYNVTAEEIEKKITEKTKAVIPVHFAGQSCDMEAIQKVVHAAEKRHGQKIFIIEDASHALGSVYRETKVGSCAYSDMATMSFHPVKHITTGEGGVVFTNDEKIKRQLSYFRSHGITNDPEELTYKDNAFETGDDGNKEKKTWYYEQNCLGYNYRITDIQCALGLSQLKKLDQFCDKRRKIVNLYNEAFKGVDGITIPLEEVHCQSNYHLYVLLIDFKKIGVSRNEFMGQLRCKGIQTQVHYIPVHTQPYYRNNFGTNLGDCPQAEKYYEQCLSIPLHPQLTKEDMNNVIASIKELVCGVKC